MLWQRGRGLHPLALLLKVLRHLPAFSFALDHLFGRARANIIEHTINHFLLNDRYGERFRDQDLNHLQPLPSGILQDVRLVARIAQ